MKALISMRICACWSGLSLPLNCIRALFICYTTYATHPAIFDTSTGNKIDINLTTSMVRSKGVWIFKVHAVFKIITANCAMTSKDISHCIYCIYLKYWNTLSTYHTCPKIWNSPSYYLLMCLKYCCMCGKHCRPWSDATFSGIWPLSILFAKVCLSQNLGLLL